MHLLAETGGKNATIVTALSDRDQAIKNVLHSAFSHSGQKCSATSLLILESEVYHDAKFRDALCDAVESLARRLGLGRCRRRSARSSARRPACSKRASKNSSPAKRGPSCRGCTSTTIRTSSAPA